MKKAFRNMLVSVGIPLLLITVASAQDFNKNGLQGVNLQNPVVPSTPLFTNCGTGCTSYNTTSGYYVSGTSLSTGAGQTLAMGFTPTAAASFLAARTPNTVYTTNGGVSTGRMTAALMVGTTSVGPGSLLATLVQQGTIPDYPVVSTVVYLPSKPITLAANTTYFLCETEPNADVQLLWMVSNSDLTSPFWFQAGDTCGRSATWLNTTGAVDGAAFEIN